MKRLITGALGAFVLLSIVAGAQAQPGRIPDIGVGQPRFMLEALRFKAIDETGRDRLGSDEVVVIIEITDAEGFAIVPGRRTVTKVFEDVDTGETHRIPTNQSCMHPIAGVGERGRVFRGDKGETWSCSVGGAPGPFGFFVHMKEIDRLPFEFDDGSPEGETIGYRQVVYSLEEMLGLQVGQAIEESVTLGGPCGHHVDGDLHACGGLIGSTGPEYVFTWRLTRLPDVRPSDVLCPSHFLC